MPAASTATNSSACTAWARCCTRRCARSCRSVAVRVYAPVGGHTDLLAYLVRRLLENGANSSFVAVAADPSVPVAALLKRPQHWIGDAAQARHPNIPLPRDLYGPERRNSAGVEFGHQASLDALAGGGARAPTRRAAPAAGRRRTGRRSRDGRRAGARFRPGRRRRSRSVPRSSNAPRDLMEARRGALIALMQREGGKTLDDASPRCARRSISAATTPSRRAASLAPQPLPGPTGESNELALSRPRRVRLHQPVEFSAVDFHRAGGRGACRRQRGRGQAGRADAARRRRSGADPARGRRSARRAAARARRRQDRRGAGRGSRAPPASPSPARPRSRARSIARWRPRTARSCR